MFAGINLIILTLSSNLSIMNEKQPYFSNHVAEQDCSQNKCSNCYTYSGCMHQPYSFWQAFACLTSFQMQPSEQVQADLFLQLQANQKAA